MSIIQFQSVAPPLDQLGIGPDAARTLGRAEAMGLLRGQAPIRRLDLPLLERLLRQVARAAGVGRDLVAEIAQPQPTPEQLGRVLRRLYDELEQSPVPASEWQALLDQLGSELVTALVSVSPASVRRYASGARATPDAVADRLHFLALVVADLAGSYNAFGVRRWFARARPQLEGKSPAQLLRGEWRSDQAGPRQVRELAHALTGPLAT